MNSRWNMPTFILLSSLSSLFLLSVTGESNVTGSHEPITVTVNHDAILPCHLEPPFDVKSLTVEWRRNKKLVHTYQSQRDDPDGQDEIFKGRTSLFHEEMHKGNISLKLSNATDQDAGTYSCFVPKLPSQVRRGYVNLTVEQMKQGNQTHEPEPDTGKTDGTVMIGIVLGIVLGIGIAYGITRCRPDNERQNQQHTQEAISLNSNSNTDQ